MLIPELSTAQYYLKDFCEAYNSRDLNYMMNLFSDNIIMWGSAVDEYRVGKQGVREQLQRDWSQSESGKIDIEFYVPSPRDALWAAADCTADIVIGNKIFSFKNLRGTIIIERSKENDEWKISHMHTSFPDYRNECDQSFPSER